MRTFYQPITHELSKEMTRNIADEQWLNFEEIVIQIFKETEDFWKKVILYIFHSSRLIEIECLRSRAQTGEVRAASLQIQFSATALIL